MTKELVFKCGIKGCQGTSPFLLKDMNNAKTNFVTCQECGTIWYGTSKGSCCRITITFKSSNSKTGKTQTVVRTFKR